MASVDAYLSPKAIDAIRRHVREAKGREVFLCGTTDDGRIVEDVTVLARGNAVSAPAILQVAQPGEVVIHNHPSGFLEPSDADISVASILGNQGVGFFVVNNDVTDIFVVVEPFEKKVLIPIDREEVQALLKGKGDFKKKLDNYELRPQQLEMAGAVVRAFNENKIAVVEAGTGVGKTLAYLIPAVFWATQNKERVVVSTKTINLQEQILKKDIPFLQSVLDTKFNAVLVKGRTNYACLRKVHELDAQPDLVLEGGDVDELKTLIAWAKRSEDGSKADLPFVPRDEVWEKIQSESDTTLRAQCPFYSRCFFYQARRKAATADILVVNHHLLFSDLALREAVGEGSEIAVLPPYQRVILDEAHSIEEVATQYFGQSITHLGILRMLSRLHRKKRDETKGLFHFLMAKLTEHSKKVPRDQINRIRKLIDNDLVPSVETLEAIVGEVMEDIFHVMRAKAGEVAMGDPTWRDGYHETKLRITPAVRTSPEWKSKVIAGAERLVAEIRKFTAKGASLLRLLEEVESVLASARSGALGERDVLSLTIDIRAQLDRLDAAANTIDFVLLQYDDENIRWLECRERPRGNIVRLHSSPLEVADTLRKAVYDRFKTVVMTSATLAVEGRLNYLESRIGLDQVDPARRISLILSSPFDYQRQAIIGIPLDIPAPDDPDFPDALAELVYKALTISGGRAFVLFTSFHLLNRLHTQLEGPLERLGINALKQGTESRHRLLERFKQDKTSVLFGTDSFWEGVDVHGDALESVIITKLPFKVPTEPVLEARVEAIQKRGGNPFMEYVVPQAAIKFKQGFGRLIRRKTDRGSIVIFDKRVVEKTYGKVFLRTLPPCPVVAGPRKKVFAALERFFNGGGEGRWYDYSEGQ